jgi:hypothetical protein
LRGLGDVAQVTKKATNDFKNLEILNAHATFNPESGIYHSSRRKQHLFSGSMLI